MSVPSLDQLDKGHQLPPLPFELTHEWVREYAAAVEDEAIRRLDGDLVPPMAVAALALRAMLEGAKLPAGAIHLGQELAFHRPVRVGERLSASARVASRGERRGWILMSVDMTVEGDGGVVMTGRATATMPSAGEAA